MVKPLNWGFLLAKIPRSLINCEPVGALLPQMGGFEGYTSRNPKKAQKGLSLRTRGLGLTPLGYYGRRRLYTQGEDFRGPQEVSPQKRICE